MPASKLRPALFLDRDGVIIENNPNYVRSVAETHFIPGALEALARFHLARPEWRVIIATNQAGVGRGLIASATVEAIHALVREQVRAAGGRIDGIYLCPHRSDENCACRKPSPGMLLQAARDWGLDLARSVMVGDAVTDVQAALAAGVTPLLVQSGLGTSADLSLAGLGHIQTWPDLASAIAEVLRAPE
jgi:D-glycero-D-manno-heptose 1,7-bisphosphate phosphatase